ncbi:MAG: DUF488 domain-containing protein [Deltaproteobacteria bacterium]|nr:DUF488 domain-containing protein [Deltaproteobacteria bacterium]
MIRIKRAYEAPEPTDGTRVLVDRLWPRGVKKEALDLDVWAKDVAPSAELRQWFGHRGERWQEFRRRYRAELRANPDGWSPILEATRRGPVTLVYGARDAEHNDAVVLRDFLAEHPTRRPRGGRKAPSGRPRSEVDCGMAYEVNFEKVSTVGLESSPVAAALAGLRANEARYFKNKYDQVFVVEPASKARKLVDYVHRILKQERDIVIASRPLEATQLHVDNIRWTHVFYQSGLAINVLYTLDGNKKRAVGFKLSEGMEIPAELASFKFARQKSKLAGTIRGSYFVIKGEY